MATYKEISSEGGSDEKGVCTYQRKFRVVMDTYAQYAPAAWSIVPVARYDAYPADSNAVAVKVRANLESDDQLGVYIVQIDYTSAPIDEGNSGDGSTQSPTQTDQSTSPPARPLQFSFGSNATTRLLGPLDLAGVGVFNSAGQPFDPPPEIPTHNLTFSVTCYRAIAFDWVGKNNTYQDAINDANWNIIPAPGITYTFPKQTVKCNKYTGSTHQENGTYYWELQLEFEVKKSKWNPRSFLDAGTVYKESGSLPPQPILDATGNPVQSPVPLNGAGKPLPAGGTPVYKDFQAYNEVNFNLMLS